MMENLEKTLSFNLVDSPWIPVEGETTPRSLLGIFTEPVPLRLSGNPVDKIVILRLLLTIVHASCKIRNEEEWRSLSINEIAEHARNYLQSHRDQFDLYGDKPFLQYPQLFELAEKTKEEKKEKENIPLSCLNFYVSTGNKSILTGWNLNRPLSDEEKAVLLLRGICYSTSGKKYNNEISLTSSYQKKKSGASGTLLGDKGKGYLHAYWFGGNLWETLKLNLLTEEEVLKLGTYQEGMGIPPWEGMPSGEFDDSAKKYRNSYLGHLLPLDKFILIDTKHASDDIIWTDGIPYENDPLLSFDPALTLLPENKGERPVLSVSFEKRPWRELSSLLSFLKTQQKSDTPYLLACGLKKLRINPPDTIGIWTGGVPVNFNAGEQYVSGRNDYAESEFIFPSCNLGNDKLTRYEELMCNYLEKVLAVNLGKSVSSYFKEVNPSLASEMSKKAVADFWTRVEPYAQKMIDLTFCEHQNEEEMSEFRCSLYQKALNVFDTFCHYETARKMQKYVDAKKQLKRQHSKYENLRKEKLS